MLLNNNSPIPRTSHQSVAGRPFKSSHTSMGDTMLSAIQVSIAGDTGVEPAPYCVTDRHLIRLTYRPKKMIYN